MLKTSFLLLFNNGNLQPLFCIVQKAAPLSCKILSLWARETCGSEHSPAESQIASPSTNTGQSALEINLAADTLSCETVCANSGLAWYDLQSLTNTSVLTEIVACLSSLCRHRLIGHYSWSPGLFQKALIYKSLWYVARLTSTFLSVWRMLCYCLLQVRNGNENVQFFRM